MNDWITMDWANVDTPIVKRLVQQKAKEAKRQKIKFYIAPCDIPVQLRIVGSSTMEIRNFIIPSGTVFETVSGIYAFTDTCERGSIVETTYTRIMGNAWKRKAHKISFQDWLCEKLRWAIGVQVENYFITNLDSDLEVAHRLRALLDKIQTF